MVYEGLESLSDSILPARYDKASRYYEAGMTPCKSFFTDSLIPKKDNRNSENTRNNRRHKILLPGPPFNIPVRRTWVHTRLWPLSQILEERWGIVNHNILTLTLIHNFWKIPGQTLWGLNTEPFVSKLSTQPTEPTRLSYRARELKTPSKIYESRPPPSYILA